MSGIITMHIRYFIIISTLILTNYLLLLLGSCLGMWGFVLVSFSFVSNCRLAYVVVRISKGDKYKLETILENYSCYDWIKSIHASFNPIWKTVQVSKKVQKIRKSILKWMQSS